MKILSYLNEQQLIKCRIVSYRWNEICCLLLEDELKKNPHTRPDLVLEKSRGEPFLDCKTVIKKPLIEFLDCFFPSEAEISTITSRLLPRPFPFSNFRISGLNYMYLDTLTNFVLTFPYGRHMIMVWFLFELLFVNRKSFILLYYFTRTVDQFNYFLIRIIYICFSIHHTLQLAIQTYLTKYFKKNNNNLN